MAFISRHYIERLSKSLPFCMNIMIIIIVFMLQLRRV